MRQPVGLLSSCGSQSADGPALSWQAEPATHPLHKMTARIHADTLRPSHCQPQPGLPCLLRLGHTEEGQAPVLLPLPHTSSLWLDADDTNAALALAEDWALQLLLQAPASHLEVYVHDSGLDTSLSTLERMAAAAKAKGLAQRVHFITDAAGLLQLLC